MIGTGELIIILGIVLLLFGGKKLPEIAKNLGKGMREFKRACYEVEGEVDGVNGINGKGSLNIKSESLKEEPKEIKKETLENTNLEKD